MTLSTPISDTPEHGFSRDIQILRGIAVVMTFFAHVPGVYPQFKSILFLHFWTGVDLFFVISGYVIARSFFPKMVSGADRTEKIKLSVAFWMKRLYRLFPASAFWAFFLLICAFFFNRSGIFATGRDVLNEVIAFLLYSKNIAAAYGINFSLGPYWSLSLEEQFYFVLPIVLIFLPKILRPVIYMPAVLLVAAFSGFLGPHYHLFRSEYFLVGIFIYQIRASDLDYIIAPVFLENRAARILFVPVCLAIMMLVPSYLGYLSGNAFFVLLACGALVFAASYDNLLFPKGRWTGERLRWIGDRSYSFYLSHIAALLLVYELTFRCTGQELKVAGRGQALVAVGAAFVLTLLFATASWRWLEKPMQRRGRQRSSDYLQRLAGQSPR